MHSELISTNAFGFKTVANFSPETKEIVIRQWDETLMKDNTNRKYRANWQDEEVIISLDEFKTIYNSLQKQGLL